MCDIELEMADFIANEESPEVETTMVETEPWPIYVDGSFRETDGKSYCGYGVFYGAGDARNKSVVVEDEQANNQRAELLAIIHALRDIKENQTDQAFCIRTDSNSSIQSITVLLVKWEKFGWRTKKKTFVKNKDLIQNASLLYREILLMYRKRGWKFRIEHIKGHSGEIGNEGADRLAVEAAGYLENI